MTVSGTKTYSGIYKARCVSVTGSEITAYVPQMFGDVKITMQSAIGGYPTAGSFGYVVFEGGDPSFPVWAGSNYTSATAAEDEPLHRAVTVATKEPIGHTDKTQSVISFNNSTRTFSISPVGEYFEVWCVGTAYRKASTETVIIPNVSDLYYIYYSNEGVLEYKNSYITWDTDTPTAYVYWNATTGKAEFFADERHGIVLDWQTHEYLHRTRGAAIANGFDASNYVLGGNGSLNSHAQIDISNGTFFDEDLQVDITHSNSPTANTWQQDLQGPARIPVLYRSDTHWMADAPTDFPMKQGTTTIQYNTVSGSTWATTDVANNSYVPMFIVATNNLNYPILAVMGQITDSNISNVRDYNWSSMSLGDFPSVEFRPLYKLIIQSKTSAANTVKAVIAEVDDLRYLDSGVLTVLGPQGPQGPQGAQGASSGVTSVAGTASQVLVNGVTGAQTGAVTLSLGDNFAPSGMLAPYAGSSAPTGWLLCHGQAISRTTYAALFTAIGTTYGVGNGSTTFNLPDLRGRIPVALDNMGGTDAGLLSTANTLGLTGGAESVTLSSSQIPAHTHSAGSYDGTTGINNATVVTSITGPEGTAVTGTANALIVTSGAATTRVGVNANTGGGGSHTNMQPYILMNYIIKT